jgi:hypothetical protein
VTAARWAREHDKLLRIALKLPLLWRVAYRIILKHAAHDDDKGLCLVCAAADRRNQNKHQATMSVARQLYCKKCGLSLSRWIKEPRCSGRMPRVSAAPQDTNQIRIVPLNW